MSSVDAATGSASGRIRARLRAAWDWFAHDYESAIGVIVALLLLIVVLFGRAMAPQNPDATDLLQILKPPSAQHWFGTDEVGRDIFSRLLTGAWYTMSTAVLVVGASTLIGTILGVLAGFLRGAVGFVIGRLTDLFLGYPTLLLAIAVSAALGAGLLQAAIALTVVVWAGYARIAYTSTTQVMTRQYVDASTVSGVRAAGRLFKHVVPNSTGPIAIKLTMDLALAAEWIASLGFLGLGATPPTPEWGSMIAQSRSYALSAWWYPLFPSLFLLLSIVGLVYLGSAIESHLSGRRTVPRSVLRMLHEPIRRHISQRKEDGR